MVRHIGFYWRRADQAIHERANKLLEALPWLETLSIRAEWDEEPFYPRFFEVNTMPNLREFTLFDPRLTIDNMQRYMALGPIEHVTIWCRFLGVPLWLKSLKHSPVLTLDLDRNHHIPAEVLLEVLKWCPRIRKLRCALPGLGVLVVIGGTTRKMATPLSPLGLSKALASAQNSLQNLEFLVCPCKWPSQENSKMDLSMMRVLRSITCQAQCFFASGESYSARSGLYKLLPRSVAELIVSERTIREHFGKFLDLLLLLM
jgi:hypothetical protein